MAPAIWNEQEFQQKPNFKIGQDIFDNHTQKSLQPLDPLPKDRRLVPLSHPVANVPICIECQALETSFFDPGCGKCMRELTNPSLIFAVLRQWVPQVQQRVETLIDIALTRCGAHADDRDSVTDMTFLMFACKAGAAGVGDPMCASRAMKKLLVAGASLESRCKWTDMTALHYASYFDVEPMVSGLLMVSKGVDVDVTCGECDNGTSLHIAASNLSLEAAKVLLTFGADVTMRDDLARLPIDCIPDHESEPLHDLFHNVNSDHNFVLGTGNSFTAPSDEARLKTNKMKILLTKGLSGLQKVFPEEKKRRVRRERSPIDSLNVSPTNGERQRGCRKSSVSSSRRSSSTGVPFVVSSKAVLQSLNMKLGDRVLVNGDKFGTLEFCGTVQFAGGTWAGVSLDEPEGKNDGTVNTVPYFECSPDHGVFVPTSKIEKVGKNYRPKSPGPMGNPLNKIVNHGRVDVSRVGSRLSDAMTQIAERAMNEIRVGDRVTVSGLDISHQQGDKMRRYDPLGTVRFVGPVDFVDDDARWYGVDLDEPVGRHDGTVQGVRYFAASENHGVFVSESKLKRVTGTKKQKMRSSSMDTLDGEGPENQSFSMNYHNLATNSAPKPRRPVRRSLSAQHRAIKASIEGERSESPAPSSSLSSSYARTQHTPRIKPAHQDFAYGMAADPNFDKGPGWKTVSEAEFTKFTMKRSPAKKFLEPGTSVICIHNKEMAVVKYVGRVAFADGIWVGLELRVPRPNRHDGLVRGRRYFACGPNRGVFLRPKMLSVHGINGADLIRPESEYPF